MKLCPQCAFIYEDAQTLCDMDGKELIPNPPETATESTAVATRLTITVPPKTPRRRVPVVAVVALLAIFLAGLCVIQLSSRSGQTAAALDKAALAIPPVEIVDAHLLPPPVTTNLLDQEDNLPTEAVSADANSNVAELRNNVSASNRLRSISTGTSQNPVLLRLTNGATIRADEAWERREGIWYRQGGLITFLKRSQVRSIERTGSLPRSTDQRQVQDVLAQNQSRPVKTASVEVKKESKVSSILKKTGRILKRPFKF